MTHTVIDLFSGPGGLSTGFENAGFSIASAVDYDESAVDTYNQNHEIDARLDDIRELETEGIVEDIERNGFNPDEVDGVIGGPPCKGFSLANMNTRSPDNPMNNLFFHFIRVVRDVNPEFFVMENVPGLLSMGKEKGDVKGIILEETRELGYIVRFKVLKAEQYGVPQSRRRVFFIGVKTGSPVFPSPTHTEEGKQQTLGSSHNLKPAITVSEAILDLPELSKGGGGKEKMEYTEPPHSDYAEKMRDSVGETLWNHNSTVNRETTIKRFEHIPQGGNWEDIPDELMENYTDKSRTHGHIYYRLKEDETALTVANFRKSMMVHPTQNRLLSVREAARLQSFPDDYRFVSSRISDKQQMVGDAVPVRLAESIGRAVKKQLQKQSKRVKSN